MINKIILSLLFLFPSTDIVSQLDKHKSDYHDDSEIDEMPDFIVYRLKDSKLGTYNPHDLAHGITLILESCASKKMELVQVHSQPLRDIGFLPSEFWQKGKIYIAINEAGKVEVLKIYNVAQSSQLKLCLLALFDESHIMPAYKDNHPVKCYLEFMIK